MEPVCETAVGRKAVRAIGGFTPQALRQEQFKPEISFSHMQDSVSRKLICILCSRCNLLSPSCQAVSLASALAFEPVLLG